MRERFLIKMPNGECVGAGKTLKAAVKCTLKFFYYTEIAEKNMYGIEIDTNNDTEIGKICTQELYDIAQKFFNKER